MSDSRPQKNAEEITTWNFVFPNQTNPYGTMFGGELLAIMDSTAALAAIRFAERTVSTVAAEVVKFKHPIVVGDRIKTVAKVVLTGSTSVMVRTDVYLDMGSGEKEKHCTSAHFALVAFDDARKPVQVPGLIVNDSNQRDYKQALAIKEHAQRRDGRIQDLVEAFPRDSD